MPRINFNNCSTLDDVARRHADELTGKILLQYSGVRDPRAMTGLRTPILGCRKDGQLVIFDTENSDMELISLQFRSSLEVVTSINEAGDVWWSPDGYKHTIYGIDDLDENDFDVDSVLRFANSLPAENLLQI